MTKNQIRLKIIEKYGAQIRFAKALGVRDSLVSKIICGHRAMTEEQHKQWSKLLGIKPGDLPREIEQ